MSGLTQITPDVISTNTISGLISAGFTSMNVATMGTQTIEFGSSNTLVFRANTSTERMRVSNTGFVGIGTASPVRPFHVSGSGTVARFESSSATNATVAEIFLPNFTAGQFARLAWRANTATTIFSAIDAYFNNLTTGSETGDIAFSTINAGAGLTEKLRIAANGQIVVSSTGSAGAPVITKLDDLNTGIFFPAADTIAFSEGGVESMRIDSSGQVGIGTSSPSVPLAIYKASDSAINIQNSTSGVTNIDGLQLLLSGSNGYMWNYENGANIFGTNNTERMRIDSAGLVGIGCTPVNNLQVNATSDVGVAMSNSNSVTSGNRGTISMFNSGTSTVGYIRFGAVTDNVGTDIQFATRPAAGSITERVRITSAGYTGVNTASPRALFNVQNGNIISETTSRGSEVVNASAVSSTGETNATTGWSVSGLGISGMSSVGTDNGITPQNGSFQLKLTGVNNGERVDYGFSVVAGKRYQVSFYANKYQGQYYFLSYVATTNSGDNYGQWVSDDINNGLPQAITAAGWNQYTITFSAPTSGTYYLSFRMATGSSPSTITYIDNMSIKEITGSVTTGGNISGYNVFAGGTLSASNIVTGSGVTFPATQSASSDANTLDDYEEGTWTATPSPSISGSFTTSINTGWYVKVGKMVTVGVNIFMSSVSSPVGTVNITGLPFTSANSVGFRPAVCASGLVLSSFSGPVSGQINHNSTAAILVVNDQGNWASTITGSSQIQFMASYVTA